MGRIIQEHQRLGARLLERRRELGLSLTQVEDLHGISKGVLSRIERGETIPTVATLKKLRAAYAVDDRTFIGWVDVA